MNQSFKTLQELAEEEATYVEGSSLRSYYSAHEGTLGSRTSSVNTVQFEGIKAAGEDCHEGEPHSPGRVMKSKQCGLGQFDHLDPLDPLDPLDRGYGALLNGKPLALGADGSLPQL